MTDLEADHFRMNRRRADSSGMLSRTTSPPPRRPRNRAGHFDLGPDLGMALAVRTIAADSRYPRTSIACSSSSRAADRPSRSSRQSTISKSTSRRRSRMCDHSSNSESGSCLACGLTVPPSSPASRESFRRSETHWLNVAPSRFVIEAPGLCRKVSATSISRNLVLPEPDSPTRSKGLKPSV